MWVIHRSKLSQNSLGVESGIGLRIWHEKFCKNGMRILIADDQRSVGTTLAALVSHCQHEVVEVVGSGLEAIQAYDRYKPDVVLMDYWMAKLNGATACRNIVSKDPAARVILVSGWSPTQHPQDSGAIAILAKPVNLPRLEKALDEAAQGLTFRSAPDTSEPEAA
jgi:two-component system chemotaxis response regulator CheY